MNGIPQIFNSKPLIHAWNYCAKDGEPFGVVGRYQDGNGKKEIVPFFKPNGSSFAAGIELNPRPLFGLDKLAAQPKDKAVFFVEGEKSAAALHSIGVCAITSLGGSQSAGKADWMPLNVLTDTTKAASQIRIVVSVEAETICLPSGEKATP